jgi:hypothetical protein
LRGLASLPFDSESERREPEVGAGGEKDVCDYAVWPSLPFCHDLVLNLQPNIGSEVTVYTEGNEKHDANSEVGTYMWVAPFICTTCPVESQKHQGSSGDKEETANRVTSPNKLFKAHFRVVGAFLGPIEGKEADRCETV